MRWLVVGLGRVFRSRLALLAEIACLRQQLAVYKQRHPRPHLQDRDRRFWIVMARGFSGWKDCLLVVTPGTVLHWHRKGWRHYWRWRSSQRRAGRKRIPLAIRQWIRRMAQENLLWGQRRIMAELLKLGYVVSPRTVRRYMRRSWNGTPSPRWRDFLRQHAQELWACDFLAIRTLTFQTLYVFFLMHHTSRAIVHVRATRHPTAAWTAQQVVNACFEREPPTYLLHDRDSIFGSEFSRRVSGLGTRELRTPLRAPKANGIAERFVGTLRRECLDHVFIFNERHLQKLLDEFVVYYNRHRPHRSLGQRPPCFTEAGPIVTRPPSGSVIAEPVLGGLHHVYRRAA